jgi:adenylylsulfate kinase-like enzyme/SAM-dependent methyltransferase
LNNSTENSNLSGVIWITGFTSAGKTTVGRKVQTLLKEGGMSTIFLDGDDLRSIFAGQWGYERSDRVELARVYFRLCSHLASQGYIVVIAAVAMYNEVRSWMRENVPRILEVYLDVPDGERKRRDRETKKIYEKIGDLSKLYDLPDDRVLRIENHGRRSPENAAEEIVTKFMALNEAGADFGREGHWKKFYSSGIAPSKPSPFAEAVRDAIKPGSKLLEVGCGNGRDAMFFSREGHSVSALDPSASAIDSCIDGDPDGKIKFVHGMLQDVVDILPRNFDVVYSRFVIHAMPLSEEERLLRDISTVLEPGGSVFIECRSINDQMARQGEIISPTERILGHYRRFIIKEDLEARLRSNGFMIVSSVESKGLAVFGDEDPVIIRVEARLSE